MSNLIIYYAGMWHTRVELWNGSQMGSGDTDKKFNYIIHVDYHALERYHLLLVCIGDYMFCAFSVSCPALVPVYTLT